MNIKNDLSLIAKYSKRNMKIQTTWFVVAFILWGSGSFLLWNGKFPFVSFFVFVIIAVNAVNYYTGWKKYKNKQEV